MPHGAFSGNYLLHFFLDPGFPPALLDKGPDQLLAIPQVPRHHPLLHRPLVRQAQGPIRVLVIIPDAEHRHAGFSLQVEEGVDVRIPDVLDPGRVPDGLGRRLVDQAGRDPVHEIRVVHEFGRDVGFAAEGFGDGPFAAEVELAQRDLEAGGRFLAQGFQGGGGPDADVGLGVGGGVALQGGEDVFDAGVPEAAVDGLAQDAGELHGFVVGQAGAELVDGGGDGVAAGSQAVVVLEDEFAQTGGEGGQRGGVDVVGGDAGPVGLHAAQLGARERQVGAQAAVQARQEEAAADVREEADAGLGHGEDGPLGGDAQGRVHRQPHPAAHRDPVHVRDVRLRVHGDEVVELVFEPEVGFRGLDACFSGGGVLLRQRRDVPARAKGSGARAGYQHHLREVGFRPFE